MASPDPSNGWNAAADVLLRERSTTIGVAVLRAWAAQLPPQASVLDLGCGAGEPVSSTLVALGHTVTGIDASPRIVAAYRARFPGADVVCEPAEATRPLGQRFDGVVAIGLLFLLDEAAQRAVVARVSAALRPGGRFLFTAPWQTATWVDPTTGCACRSLGRAGYGALLTSAGLVLDDTATDEGGNHHFSARRV